MKQVHCFSSFNFAYLSRALILARTLRTANPELVLWALMVDVPPPDFDLSEMAEFSHVIYAHELNFDRFHAWMFKHNVVEACTAVKGQMLRYLLDQGASKVLYFDPDIAIFHPVDQLCERLDAHSIVLTPHQAEPDEQLGAIQDNERTSLQYGVFNLGFVGVCNDDVGKKFADWWAQRLYLWCYEDVTNGIFTDQKWCDLVPAMFERVYVERDPGCNLASWNLSRRQVAISRDGIITVNGSPLKFYHFTKINSAGDLMTEKYAGDNTEVYEVWNWYKRTLALNSSLGVPRGYWHYGRFSNGETIPEEARLLFRNRQDLSAYFDNPFDVSGNSFYEWMRREQPEVLGDGVPAG